MRTRYAGCNLAVSIALLLTVSLAASADPIAVRSTQGTLHGFLVIRSQPGAQTSSILGYGEFTQIAEGDRVTADLVYRFRDGSVDHETTVFTQRGTFQLVSDHHIQRGPFFPKPSDITVEANGQVTLRTTGKDGRIQVETTHMDLPPDTSNGMIGTLLVNVPASATGVKLGMVVPSGKGRLIHLAIAADGHASFNVAGAPRNATVFLLKPELGGVAGVVAPVIGKQPPNIAIWILEGDAPLFVREIGQLSEDGPIVSIEFAGATFPRTASPPKPKP